MRIGGGNTGLNRKRGTKSALIGSIKRQEKSMGKLVSIWAWIQIIILFSYISFFDEWNNFFFNLWR